MQVSFSGKTLPAKGAVAVLVYEGGALSPSAGELDGRIGGAIGRAVNRAMEAGRFKGGKGEVLELVAPAGVELSRVLLAGLGKAAEAKPADFEAVGGTLVAKANAAGDSELTVLVDAEQGPDDAAAHCGLGGLLRSYRFDKYKTKEKPEKKPSLTTLTVGAGSADAARAAFAPLEGMARAIFMTRDLVSEPANVIYPETFVAEARKLSDLGVKIEVLGEDEMRRLGMGALLGVGQGSVRESKLLVMIWEGNGPVSEGCPIAFVGKGVCFDTGGISIKPAGGMEDMKWDMGGAGVVVGVMGTLAARKAKVTAVGICGLVENMPDGNAQRPGDIVTSMSGQTIEVINTDAEGRLVLADALWYVQQTYKPKTIVDLATLTGAIIISLGKVHAGLFSNDDGLSERLTAAGKAVGELLWRMPMGEEYDRAIDSAAADMKNVGDRAGGSITAAQFIQRFIQEGVAWAHLDIAGVTWSDKDTPTVPKGATAFGVRLLNDLVARHYEAG